jgi:iron complex transport system substrate-binding protein
LSTPSRTPAEVDDPRILSLIPSATDWVTELGMAAAIVGATHECEAPEGVPVVVTPAVHHDPTDPAGVDAAVTVASAEGRALYAVDENLVSELAPTVILTQQLCDVCAVSAGQIHRLAKRLGGCAIVELDGLAIEGVLADGLRVAEALGVPQRGQALVSSLRDRMARVERAVAGVKPRSVAFLEWSDPPWAAGHWVPEQITAAGGTPTVGRPGEPSERAEWDAFAGADVMIVGPCGYVLDEAVSAAEALADRLPSAGEVWAVDAHHHFSRPAPGMVIGVESLAGILHPDRHPAPAPTAAKRIS